MFYSTQVGERVVEEMRECKEKVRDGGNGPPLLASRDKYMVLEYSTAGFS